MKKAQIAIIFILILFLIAIAIILFYAGTQPNFNCNEKCLKECNRFNYTFYKMEHCGLRWEKCWCFDENKKPEDIGGLP